MESAAEDFGAVAVAGVVKYELIAYNGNQLKLLNNLQIDQYIIIDVEALPGLVSILNKAATRFQT
jgi:hypothetical protein